jgi:hypothetical protein
LNSEPRSSSKIRNVLAAIDPVEDCDWKWRGADPISVDEMPGVVSARGPGSSGGQHEYSRRSTEAG